MLVYIFFVFDLQADLKDLKILDLFGCPITESDDYRQKVFNLLPQLELLDRADKDGKEVEVESEDQDDEEEDSEEEVGLDYLNQDLKVSCILFSYSLPSYTVSLSCLLLLFHPPAPPPG